MAKPVSFRVSDVIDEEIEKIAKENGVTKSEICRQALLNGLGETVKTEKDYSTNDKVHGLARHIIEVDKDIRRRYYNNLEMLKGGIDRNSDKISDIEWSIIKIWIVLIPVIILALWGL